MWQCPACALIQLNSAILSCCSISMTLVQTCSMICVCFFWFCSICSVILLSVYSGTVFSSAFENCIYSNAFRKAICSGWLMKQRPFRLYFSVALRLLSEKIAITDPNPLSLLLSSVYICMYFRLFSGPSIILTCFAEWIQVFTSISLSYWIPFPFVIS